jgi:phosphoribosyl 1,2-cyclic phosphodiesterase
MPPPENPTPAFGTNRKRCVSESFYQKRPPLHWVGLLSRVSGRSNNDIRLDRSSVTIGRKACDVLLPDESVSRQHARIQRNGDDFILEDLASFNGTHINGTPVLSCVLRDGDTVQFGQNLFLFERLLERAIAAPMAGPLAPPKGGLTIRFWGTRGSIPTPGPNTEKYGGNTTCLELRYNDTLLVFDAGSGIRDLGTDWAREFADRPVKGHLLFTHLHWDHIQGFPFFVPAYRKGNSITIYGAERTEGGIRELLGGQMSGPYFPVPLAAMQANLDFRPAPERFDVGPIAVRTTALPHPGGCLGFRLEVGGSTFVLATDCELDQVALNADEVRANPLVPRRYNPALLDFFKGAHMIVIDCQYTDEQYATKRGWGHNGVATVADLCIQVQPDALVLFHHDPASDDKAVASMVDDVYVRLAGTAASGTLVLAAREQLVMRVGKPIRPLQL